MAAAALAELVHILVYTSARELQCDSVENKDKLRLTLSTSTLGQLQASHLCFFEACELQEEFFSHLTSHRDMKCPAPTGDLVDEFQCPTSRTSRPVFASSTRILLEEVDTRSSP